MRWAPTAVLAMQRQLCCLRMSWSAMAEVSRHSILSICDHQGKLLRLESDSGLVGSPGQSFVSLLDSDSVAKGSRFLELLQRENVACDWTLNLNIAGRICSLTFCGIRKDAE